MSLLLGEPGLDITAAATADLRGGHRRGGAMPGGGITTEDIGAFPLPQRTRTQPEPATDLDEPGKPDDEDNDTED